MAVSIKNILKLKLLCAFKNIKSEVKLGKENTARGIGRRRAGSPTLISN